MISSPDFSPPIEGLRNAGRYIAPGMLVVLESTITPGTTTGIAREILEAESRLVAGKDLPWRMRLNGLWSGGCSRTSASTIGSSARVKGLCGSAHPAIVDGWNVVESDAWIGEGFVYRGIGRGG